MLLYCSRKAPRIRYRPINIGKNHEFVICITIKLGKYTNTNDTNFCILYKGLYFDKEFYYVGFVYELTYIPPLGVGITYAMTYLICIK